MIDDDQLDVALRRRCSASSSTLPLPSSVAGRGSCERDATARRCTVEIDGAGKPDRLVDAGLGRALSRGVCPSCGRAQDRHEDKRPRRAATPASVRRRCAVADRAVRVFHSVIRRLWLFLGSNICTGWLGMIVEMACL